MPPQRPEPTNGSQKAKPPINVPEPELTAMLEQHCDLRRRGFSQTENQTKLQLKRHHLGLLLAEAAKRGENLRCTNYPTCRYLAPKCPNCRAGYAAIDTKNGIATCSNPDCAEPPQVCPRCGTGLIVLRTNPREFWACTRYWDTPPCTFTATYA